MVVDCPLDFRSWMPDSCSMVKRVMKGWALGLLLTVILVCLLSAAAQILTEPDINDEHMYLAAARLLDHHALYRDFAFMQTPYMVYVYRWAMELFPETGMLLTARLVKLLLLALSLSVFAFLCWRFSHSLLMTSALVWLLSASAIFRSDLQYARNYQLPLLLILVSLLLFDLWSAGEGMNGGRLILIGLLLGAAVAVKLTFALVALAFVLAILLGVRGRWPCIRTLALLALGSLLSWLPLLPIYPQLASADFAYRVGDYLSEAECRRFGMTSVSRIQKLLHEDKPAALILGFDRELEKPLEEFARQQGYYPDRNIIAKATVYLRNEMAQEEIK